MKPQTNKGYPEKQPEKKASLVQENSLETKDLSRVTAEASTAGVRPAEGQELST